MKCLENLSLVEDDVVEDLKKDIEKLIGSYIDIEKACLDTFNEIVDKLTVKDIKQICSIFGSTGCEPWFHEGPHHIANFEEYLDVVKTYILGDAWGSDSVGYAFYNMFCNCGIDKFDFEDTTYWFYKDGSNWEAWLETDESFKQIIREYIHLQDADEQVIMLRKLKEIKDAYFL